MEKIKNEYQLSKTLRFGLTLKNKTARPGKNPDEIYRSHQELVDLVKVSEKRIHDKCSFADRTEIPIEGIRLCLGTIDMVLSQWLRIFDSQWRYMALDRDYYKILCKKIGFEGFWKNNKNVKCPQAREIKLVELEREFNGKPRKDYVIGYWRCLILKANEKYNEVSEKLKQYEDAVRLNLANNKPNEVELRKTFLSLASVVMEILRPIELSQITFPCLAKSDISREEDRLLVEFATDKFATDKDNSRSNLIKKIEELRTYFSENGGNVPFCIATLNPKTAVKDPKSTDNSIDGEIKELGIVEILKDHRDALYFTKYLESMSAKDKLVYLKHGQNKIVRGLLFKYTPIPGMVQREMARTLAKKTNKDENEILEFLRNMGQVKTPQRDYAEDKEHFDLEKYPLKIAFDFAWESLARAQYHEDAEIPVEACEKYLSGVFGVDKKNKHLVEYARLLELNALLATLDNKKNPPKLPEQIEIKRSAANVMAGINDSKIFNYMKAIKQRLVGEAEKHKYEKAKKSLAMFRGRLKNNVTRYDEITKLYKDIAMKKGKTFAAMRDKITGDAELHKVTHYAMILEDGNSDRYLLLQEFTERESQRVFQQTDSDGYTAYQVYSITSGAIAKMIRKERLEKMKNENSKPRENLTDEEMERRNVAEWVDFIGRHPERWEDAFNFDMKDKNFEELKKEIDSKGYMLSRRHFTRKTLERLVMEDGCLLLPIVNQDLAKEKKTENNQFTKDWNAVFAQNTPWRLTPEFRISYRKPTNGYPVSEIGDKRYSRFQMTAHFLCDYIPHTTDYVSNREQIENYKDEDKQKDEVENFNKRLVGMTAEAALLQKFNSQSDRGKSDSKKASVEKGNFFVFGIDRGQHELATLCVIDQDKKIHGDFEIYTRKFSTVRKRWEHSFLEKRHILDLSNLRVETTLCIDGEEDVRKVLVDQSSVKVKDGHGNYVLPNKMQVKMQQLAYVRKLQYKMQHEPDIVLDWYGKYKTDEDIVAHFVINQKDTNDGLVSFYGAAIEELDATLPIARIKEMLERFKQLKTREKDGDDVKTELDSLMELEPVDNLKAGVVANMVGVIAFLLEKFEYNVYISLEDLSQGQDKCYVDGISGIIHKFGTSNRDGRRGDVEKYAGLGLYNFFETQLLKKLFRIQRDSGDILHLVPSFRAQKDYDNVAPGKDKVKNQFGIVFFVMAQDTSKTCPRCGAYNKKGFKPNLHKYPDAAPKDPNGPVWVSRDTEDGKDIIHCHHCGFDTAEKEWSENPLSYIKSGDDNAAYQISVLAATKAYELAETLVDNI